MTREDILNQDYLSAKDIKKLVPEWGVNSIAKFVTQVQEDMKERKLFIPQSKSKLVLTRLVMQKLGLKK